MTSRGGRAPEHVRKIAARTTAAQCSGPSHLRRIDMLEHLEATGLPLFASAFRMSASLSKADIRADMVHVGYVPCVDGSGLAREIFTSRCWSVQPCVRPVGAVHMTAGHNALRGSGPGQKPAFDNALAHVGFPDRRFDRLCITSCSPSQPSHHARYRRDLVTPPVRRVPCSARPWPSSPKPCVQSCWRARWQRPSLGAWPATL